MAFKFICVVFLLSVAFLSVQAKNTKKHEKQHDVGTVPVYFDSITYLGDEKICTDYNRKSPSIPWCNCPFVLCTGAQQCLQMNFAGSEDISCYLHHSDIDYTADLTREDCSCRYDKK